jgi:hypothetical protein
VGIHAGKYAVCVISQCTFCLIAKHVCVALPIMKTSTNATRDTNTNARHIAQLKKRMTDDMMEENNNVV